MVSPTQHKSALEIDYKGEKGLACGKKNESHKQGIQGLLQRC